MLLVDSHQDLAWNILTFGRDYTRSAAETRRLEAGGIAPQKNGDTLLGWPEYQRGQVAVVFATLFAAPMRRCNGDWDTQCYADTETAHALYSRQLDAYHRLVNEHPDKFHLLETKGDMKTLLAHWGQPLLEGAEGHPVGLAVLMENAEGVQEVGELEEWWRRGVRIIGPAWAGTRFCGGTGEPGPLTQEGVALLEGMADLGFALDLSHMDEQAVLGALDVYPGTLAATHANAQSLLKGFESNRFLSDRVIHGIIERNGVIGVVPFNRFLQAGWQASEGRKAVSITQVVAQIDHICQLAGNAQHAGLGSDFDGGFGWQSVPHEIDTVADLPKVAPLLSEKGYNDSDIAAILGQNWLDRLAHVLPETT